MSQRGRKGGKSSKARAKPTERAPKALPTLSDDESHEESTQSSRASSPMQSEFGGSDVAEPPISPIPIPAHDDVPSSMTSQEASQKNRKKKEPLFLSDKQQADVIDFVEE